MNLQNFYIIIPQFFFCCNRYLKIQLHLIRILSSIADVRGNFHQLSIGFRPFFTKKLRFLKKTEKPLDQTALA